MTNLRLWLVPVLSLVALAAGCGGPSTPPGSPIPLAAEDSAETTATTWLPSTSLSESSGLDPCDFRFPAQRLGSTVWLVETLDGVTAYDPQSLEILWATEGEASLGMYANHDATVIQVGPTIVRNGSWEPVTVPPVYPIWGPGSLTPDCRFLVQWDMAESEALVVDTESLEVLWTHPAGVVPFGALSQTYTPAGSEPVDRLVRTVDGETVWAQSVDETSAVAKVGGSYVVFGETSISAFDESGVQLWTQSAAYTDVVWTGADDLVIYSESSGEVLGLDAAAGITWRRPADEARAFTGADGRAMIVVTYEGENTSVSTTGEAVGELVEPLASRNIFVLVAGERPPISEGGEVIDLTSGATRAVLPIKPDGDAYALDSSDLIVLAKDQTAEIRVAGSGELLHVESLTD